MKKPLKLPQFKNENEEREFWAKFDLSEYFEPEDAVQISYPNLKPTNSKGSPVNMEERGENHTYTS
jgi:hypothetical protein